jgi:hypothetical protein
MAKKWTEVIASPEYQALKPEDREAARAQYWNEVIAPQVPKDNLDAVRAQFDAEFGPDGSQLPKVAAPERSAVQSVGRQLGLTARHAIAGVAAIPAMASDALTGLYNTAADAVAGKGNGFRFMPAQAALQGTLSAAGLPEPENARERIVGDMTSALSGTGASVKAGEVLARGANSVAAAVGRGLSQGAGAQAVGAATGSAAAGTVREEGGGVGAQIAAGIAGGLAPSLGPTLARMGVRGLLRGGEEGRKRVEENIKLFQEAGGTMPTLGQATESRSRMALESGLAKAPGGAGVIAGFAQKQADDMQAAVQRLSDELAPNASAVNAGEAIKRGVDAFKAGFKAQQEELYNELGAVLPKNTPITVDRTREALAAINADIDGAPALSKWFKNARIQGIEQALQQDLKGAATGATKITEAVTGRVAPTGVDLMGQPVYRGPQVGVSVQPGATVSRPAATRPDMMGRPVPVGGAKEVVIPGEQVPVHAPVRMRPDGMGGQVPVAPVIGERTTIIPQGGTGPFSGVGVAARPGGTLPYEAIKKLRTLVGNEITDGSLVSDVPRSKWKALYAALSEDLGEAAKAAGPKAEEAWAKANDFTSQHMTRLDELSTIVKRDSPEKIFNAAISGTAEGDTIIKRVMTALPAEEGREVAAAVLQRMGRATPGQQNAMGDAFSAETFLTNLARLSPAARETLFGKDAKGIENLGKMAELRREGGRVFANPSGTAGAGAQMLVGSSLAGGIVAAGLGNFAPLAAAGSGLALSNTAAKVMTSPRIVRLAATKAPITEGMGATAAATAGRISTAAELPPEQRQVGAIYETPRGRMRWAGNGWEPAP